MNALGKLSAVLAIAAMSTALAAEPAGGGRQAAESVLAFAAASTSNALDEIKAQFTKDTGIAVRTSYAASSTLAQQIVHGAEADVFLSADTEVGRLPGRAGIWSPQRQDLLGNRLVIVVPADSKAEVKKPEDLLAAGIEHLALGEPRSVPAGRYAQQALDEAGPVGSAQGQGGAGRGRPPGPGLRGNRRGRGRHRLCHRCRRQQEGQAWPAKFSDELTAPIRYPVVLLKHGAGVPAARVLPLFEFSGGRRFAIRLHRSARQGRRV